MPADLDTLCERAEWLLDQIEQYPHVLISLPGGFLERPNEFKFEPALFVALSENYSGMGSCEYEQLSRLVSKHLAKNREPYRAPDEGVRLSQAQQFVHDWLLRG